MVVCKERAVSVNAKQQAFLEEEHVVRDHQYQFPQGQKPISIVW